MPCKVSEQWRRIADSHAWLIVQAHQLWLSDAEAVTGYEHTGCSGSMFANRLSWTFDLRGPSKAIDTACSSSLTAVVGPQGIEGHARCSAASIQSYRHCRQPVPAARQHYTTVQKPSI